LAIDNGAQVYLNGELVATETSFLVENWALPLPSIAISESGEITAVKFEEWAESFDGWNVGENEVLLAVRNPFEENDPAGGFAFRLDFFSSTPIVAGDYDGDGLLTAADIDILSAAVRDNNQDPKFDLNDDGSVDQGDRAVWVEELKNTYFGDADLDGEFNSSDMVQVFVQGKYETLEAAGWEAGDWNGNNLFDSSDMVVAFVGGGYEKGPKPNAAVSAVPEPGAIVLLAIGVWGLFSCRQRR
jgi:hypothetical protein